MKWYYGFQLICAMRPISSTKVLTHPGVWNQISGPSQLAYEVYLHHVGRWIRGAVVIAECASRGVTIARVHLYGKGRASVGLVTTDLVHGN